MSNILNSNRFHLEKSIAVLPFVNMSSDVDNEYFSDGITEEIINALTSVKGLKVIARTSSFAFKNKNEDIRTIAKMLSVNTVLEGSVRKSAARVRITVQLVNADDGVHIWSKNFDRNLDDIFAVQDEISLLVADKIRENFGHLKIDDTLVKEQAIKPNNYYLYLKGRHHLNIYNKDNLLKAISIFKKVIEIQNNFALAYVNIHYAYNSLVAGGLIPRAEALKEGKKYLDKAYKLEPNLPECHHSFGWHYLNDEWNFIKAENHLIKAIELRPGYVEAHQKLFITLILEGKIEESYFHAKTAYNLDPFTPLNIYLLAYYYYVTKNFEASNSFFEELFNLDSTFIVGYTIYGLSLTLQNRSEYILELAEKIPEIQDAHYEKLILRTLAYAKLKRIEKCREGIKELKNGLEGESRERILFSLIYIETVLGNYDYVFELIDIGIERKEPLITLLKIDPLLTPLHQFDKWNSAIEQIYKLSDNSTERKKQKAKSILSGSEKNKLQNELERFMIDNKSYLDPNLSLRELADSLSVHPNKLSWFINETIGKNFNEFINNYRLEEFKTKALDKQLKHLSLLGIAYESGFNSKTVFNAYFKKAMGLTPSAWLNSIK